MANSFTVNLNLTKPEVGADTNLWGGHLNGDMDILDGIFTSASTTLVSMVIKDDTKFVNAATTSKSFILSATLVSTSTTRTLSVPDVSGTIALDMPVAMVIPWAGIATTAPTGWLLCDGSAVSRTTYATLFAAVNTAYGVGNGSTTFNVPDMRGRVAAGLDNMGGSTASRLTSTTISPDATTAGASGGEQTHILSTGEMPSHNHAIASSLTNAGGAGVGWVAPDVTIGLASVTSNTGGGGAHNNVQPTLILNYIIKT